MPEFQYIARKNTGGQVSGLLTAGSEQDALTALAAQQLFPVRLDLADDAQRSGEVTRRRVPARHAAVFFTQLADLLKSGVPLLRSLELLSEQTSHPQLRHVIQDVREQVADGSRLAEAMRRHPRTFSDLAVSMVRAGEEGSFLEDVLKRIAAFTEHQEDLKSRVVGAMVYPVFLLVMGSIIVAGMLVFFVPKFTPIFERMQERGNLPWATTSLMAFSGWLGQYGLFVLAGVALGIFALVKHIGTDAGKLQFDRFRLAEWRLGGRGGLPPMTIGMGTIVRSLAIARFCRILGTLLRNGVPILQSLRIAKDATGNRVLSDAIGLAADSVSAGKSLVQPLAASHQFPQQVVEMIAVGEEANNLEQVLIDVADTMERRTNRQLDLLVRLLEPVMLLILAGIILFVVAALLLPILQSSAAF